MLIPVLALSLLVAACRGGSGRAAEGQRQADSTSVPGRSVVVGSDTAAGAAAVPPGGVVAHSVADTTVCAKQGEKTVYTERELNAIMDTIDAMMEVAPPSVWENAYMWCVGANAVEVTLALNTEATRRAFREHVCASPAIRFRGSAGNEPCVTVGIADTLGVFIDVIPDTLPVAAKTVSFVLRNIGTENATCGLDCSVAYERGGRWYKLPSGGIVNALGIEIGPGGQYEFEGRLKPALNNNRPGRYRVFKPVTIAGREVMLMADFYLAE